LLAFVACQTHEMRILGNGYFLSIDSNIIILNYSGEENNYCADPIFNIYLTDAIPKEGKIYARGFPFIQNSLVMEGKIIILGFYDVTICIKTKVIYLVRRDHKLVDSKFRVYVDGDDYMVFEPHRNFEVKDLGVSPYFKVVFIK